MGEIRRKVRLTNATDDVLLRRGDLAPADVRWVEVDAVVDTGAVRSVIPVQIAERLGLHTKRNVLVRYADGRGESVPMTEPIIFDILFRETYEEALVLGDTVLIGQTVLEKLDLLADCNGRRVMPHPDRPDQPVSMLR
jgi:predicted aspartyl protease